MSLPGSLTSPVRCRQPGFGGPVLVSRRVAMGTCLLENRGTLRAQRYGPISDTGTI